MIIPSAAYTFNIVKYHNKEIQELDDKIIKLIKRRLRLQDRFHADWLHLNVMEGGMGLLSLKDMYDAHTLKTTLNVVMGPPTPIQVATIQQEQLRTLIN